jgi:hypothetical protein
MTFARRIVSSALFGSLLAAAPAHPQGTVPDLVLYQLSNPASEFERGCFAPCMCPVLIQSPLAGSFVLRRSHVDPLFTYYDVLDVRWTVPGSTKPVSITGSGTYRRGGEVALAAELSLDLSFDGNPPEHFDSGLQPPGAPFPGIVTRISLHGEYCHDSVLVVDARPFAVASVGADPRGPSLTAAPNPFVGAIEIAFTLPRGGIVELGVFDVGGRRVRVLANRGWLASGAYAHAWDGRLDSGIAAPPGLYVVCLDAPSGRITRTEAKLR